MTEKNTCILIYPTRQAAGEALEKLQQAGIDLQQVSIVGKGYHGTEHPVGLYSFKDDTQHYWGQQGAFWDGLRGLLAGSAFFWVPGFGPLAAAGPIVGLLVRGLEDVTIGGGFGALGAALFNMGVPRDGIAEYEQAVTTGQFLLMVYAGPDQVEHACKTLHCEAQQVTVHRA